MKLLHWLKHDWSKWTQYKQAVFYIPRSRIDEWTRLDNPPDFYEDRQKCICNICGKVQDKLV